MLDLVPTEEPPAQTIMPAHNMDNLHPNHNTSSTVDSDVRICINDVTVDSSEDFTDGNKSELSIQELKKQQKRRSSWCPEENKKKEERKEKQRILAVTGRR